MSLTTTAVDHDHPLDLINQAHNRLDGDRQQFDQYLIGALAVTLTADQVAAAIDAAQQCCRAVATP